MPIRPAGLFWFRCLFITVVSVTAGIPIAAQSKQSATPPASPKDVEIVFLGTGSPVPNADRQGPALAVGTNGKAYLEVAGPGLAPQPNSTFSHALPALLPLDPHL